MSAALTILCDKVTALQAKLDKLKQPRSDKALSSYRAFSDDLADAAADLERIRQLTKLLMADELGLPE